MERLEKFTKLLASEARIVVGPESSTAEVTDVERVSDVNTYQVRRYMNGDFAHEDSTSCFVITWSDGSQYIVSVKEMAAGDD